LAVYTPFRTSLIANVTGGEVAETNELHRWQNTGTIHAPAPLGGGSSDRASFQEFSDSPLIPSGATIELNLGATYLADATPFRYRADVQYAWPGTDKPSTVWKLKDGANPAVPSGGMGGLWVPKNWDDNLSGGADPVNFLHPCIDGNLANNTGTYSGLIIYGHHWVHIDRPVIYNTRGWGVYYTNLAKNGTTVYSQDGADCSMSWVRLTNNLLGGIRQKLHASTNAYRDLQIAHGRIDGAGSGNTEAAIKLDRMGGCDIGHIFCFTNRMFGFHCDGEFFDSTLHHIKIEDFGANAGAGYCAGIHVRGFNGVGTNVSDNRVRQEGYSTEPGSGTLAYINLDFAGGAGLSGQITAMANQVHGPVTPRAGCYGMYYNASGGGTMYVNGKGLNHVLSVANAHGQVGNVQGSGTSTAPFV
jgi:hypothetical protein